MNLTVVYLAVSCFIVGVIVIEEAHRFFIKLKKTRDRNRK